MRLIDADALLSKYGKNIFTARTDYAEGCRDIIDDIINAPTVDVIPRDETTILGCPVQELIVFAEACKDAGITKEEMREFLQKTQKVCEWAYKRVQKEIYETIEKALKDITGKITSKG